ncbi:unnamed protein product [Caenorhabditis sp. 36 PRJEB53466]|nr:unnamed protein product [Caenorhabditis sp. 36 PRJEB53466]
MKSSRNTDFLISQWKTIRDKYVREKKKVESEGVKSLWELYDDMVWLDKFLLEKERNTKNNLVNQIDSDEAEESNLQAEYGTKNMANQNEIVIAVNQNEKIAHLHANGYPQLEHDLNWFGTMVCANNIHQTNMVNHGHFHWETIPSYSPGIESGNINHPQPNDYRTLLNKQVEQAGIPWETMFDGNHTHGVETGNGEHRQSNEHQYNLVPPLDEWSFTDDGFQLTAESGNVENSEKEEEESTKKAEQTDGNEMVYDYERGEYIIPRIQKLIDEWNATGYSALQNYTATPDFDWHVALENIFDSDSTTSKSKLNK